MARTTTEEVKEIIETELDVTPFVRAANVFLTSVMGSDHGLSTVHLKEIERWLAAHFVAIREKHITQEAIGEAQTTYGGELGKGLEFTPYGQQALTLDTTGRLAASGKREAKMETLKDTAWGSSTNS